MKINATHSLGHFQQARFGQESALRRDVKQAMTSNVTTLGRQTNKPEDAVTLSKSGRSPKMQEAASPEPPTKLGEFQASPEPSLAELEGDFFLTATETLGKTDTVALLAQAGRQSEAGEINLTMARLAKKRAESRIEECENSEQESRWRRLLETANAYLDKASRSTGLQANALEDTFEGYRLAPEKQAELMAQSHQTMLEVSEIYSKMAAERTESMAKINAIHQEAALFISKTHSKCAEARATSNDKQFQEWLRILSGRDST